MKVKLAFTAISEIPPPGSLAASTSCIREAFTKALEAVPGRGGVRIARRSASPVLEPISNVIGQRADDAHCKPSPEDAEQQHCIRALYKFLIDQMGHDTPSSRTPFSCGECNARPPNTAK